MMALIFIIIFLESHLYVFKTSKIKKTKQSNKKILGKVLKKNKLKCFPRYIHFLNFLLNKILLEDFHVRINKDMKLFL